MRLRWLERADGGSCNAEGRDQPNRRGRKYLFLADCSKERVGWSANNSIQHQQPETG